MADAKIFILILIYLSIVSLLINNVTATSQYIGADKPIIYNEYNDFRSYTNITELNYNSIHGKWMLSNVSGLYPTELAYVHNYIVGQPDLQIARCTIGSPIMLNTTSFTENYTMYVFTGLPNVYTKMLICTANYINGFGHTEYYLRIDGGQFSIEQIQYIGTFITAVRYQDLFYDMGSSREVNIMYNVKNNGNNNPSFMLYVDNVLVYNGQINDFIPFENTFNPQKEITIETNNLILNVYYVNQVYNPTLMDNFSESNWFNIIANFINTVIDICFFQVPQSIIPFEYQFIFFGIYDLGILYILLSLLRGGS